MVDKRLPEAGRSVAVNVPGVRFAARTFRVVSADWLDLHLETDETVPRLGPETPLVLTVLGRQDRLVASVIEQVDPCGLLVRLVPLAERRRQPRVQLTVAIDLDMFGRSHAGTIRGETGDISEGGLRVAMPRALRAGPRGVATIRPPGEPAIYAMVELLESMRATAEGFEARLQYTALPDDGREHLRLLVTRTSPSPAGEQLVFA